MKIILTDEEAQDFFYLALCNGLSEMCCSYGLDLRWKNEDYEAAKEKHLKKLKEVAPDSNPYVCFEDVLMQLLKDGGTLALVDEEGNEDTVAIGMQDIYDRMEKVPIRVLTNFINQNDDANDADALLQTIFYGEIIFG